MFKHILVATDGSRLSDKGVAAAIALAKSVGARLTAFYATADYPIMPFPEYPVAAESLTPAMWKADEEKRARHMLEKVAAKANKAGVACDTSFSLALRPYEGILRAAKKSRCDLIVMASHGRRGASALILGSETVKVLTHSKIPVLVCR